MKEQTMSMGRSNLAEQGETLMTQDQLKMVYGGAKSYGEELCELTEEMELSQSKDAAI
jgi:hypothetical protein